MRFKRTAFNPVVLQQPVWQGSNPMKPLFLPVTRQRLTTRSPASF
jgi:hypothetical protein